MSKIKFCARVALLLALSCMLFGCGTTNSAGKNQKMPDWVTGPSDSYPKTAYVTGTGNAVDKRAAELDAISELVAVFGQKITAASLASRRMEHAQAAGVVATATASSLDQSVLREVSQDDIIAVEIPEFFESKQEGKWYALAVMNKETAANMYISMIQKNETEINAILNQYRADKDPNTLLNYARLDFAEEVARTNEKYLKRLVILNSEAAKQFESIATPVQIHKIRMEMAAKIPICVNVDDDSDGRIAKSFQEVMASAGFNTTIGSNERYVIQCFVHLNDGKSTDGKTQFCEYVVEAGLNDTFMGETLIPLSLTGREGAPSTEAAQSRAKQKISAKVKTEFADRFQKYLGDFTAF